jgi:molybdopterin-guanine dinucleotide biosynthesis protein A
MIDACTALVLAGGESRRMGGDKTQLMLGEQTLLQGVITVLQPLFERVLVSVRDYRPDIDAAQVCDAYAGAGPLAGLCAGLAHADSAWIFAVAADMPFVRAALIERLARERGACQAVVPIVHGHPQPLAAFYASSCRAPLLAILRDNGKRSLRLALATLNVRYVDERELLAVDPGLRSFFDLDTPQDLAAARKGEWR